MPLLGHVGEPIEPLEPRAVAEMEARHRIDRQAAPVARAQEVPGGRAQQRLLASARARPGCCHQSGRVEAGERGAIVRRRAPPNSRSCARGRASAAKSGAGDSVTKVCSRAILARNLLDHLLDQEVAERHAGEPALAIGDRIEHRRRRLVRRDRLALHRQDRRDRVRNLAGQRDLDEDQRLVDQRRMEERVAAPVRRIDAAAQIVPALGSRAPPRSG